MLKYDNYFRINSIDCCIKTTAQGDNGNFALDFENTNFCSDYNLGYISAHVSNVLTTQLKAWIENNRFNYGLHPICFIDSYLIHEKGVAVLCFFAVRLNVNFSADDKILYVEEPAYVNPLDNIDKHGLVDALFYKSENTENT